MKKGTKKTKISSLSPVIIILIAFVVGLVVGYMISSSKLLYSQYEQKNDYYKMKDMSKKKGCSALTVTSPQPGQTVTDPVNVAVVVDNTNPKCQWTVFEAVAGSMELRDGNDNLVGTGILTTSEEWMTEQPVTYSGDISFMQTPTTDQLELIIHEDDPSGQSSQEVIIPLTY